MKVCILAGGAGTRLCEETATKPKALVEIGDYPILWHIMMYFSRFGFNEFVIALGYKGEVLTRWMQKYCVSQGKLVTNNGLTDIVLHNSEHNWIIHLVDTGKTTQTAGRIKRLAPLLRDETFLLTFCDGLADVDLHSMVSFHKSHGRVATLAAVRPHSRFGHLVLNSDDVLQFNEKPLLDWVNGGFFVFEPSFLSYIKDDETRLEREPMEKLAADNQLKAFRHTGFWQCMDTLAEKKLLNRLWSKGNAPWKVW